jgi:hypothetical protein
MTIKELIDKLNEYDQDRLVILSSDSEGNSFNELYGIGKCSYNKKSKDIGLEKLTDEDIKLGYGEKDVIEGVPAVCLSP